MDILKIIGVILLWVFAVAGFADTVLSLRDRWRLRHNKRTTEIRYLPARQPSQKNAQLLQAQQEPSLVGLAFASSLVLGIVWIASKLERK